MATTLMLHKSCIALAVGISADRVDVRALKGNRKEFRDKQLRIAVLVALAVRLQLCHKVRLN